MFCLCVCVFVVCGVVIDLLLIMWDDIGGLVDVKKWFR